MRIKDFVKTLSFVGLGSLAACDSGETTDDANNGAKGAEEAELGNYETTAKSDSWRKPTEHGALTAGLASSATLTADALFHAWTFELSGDADVTLTTDGGQNLDTVMYLYHRDAGSERWGSYIKKNDDHGDSVHSQIKKGLGKGEYRIMIKGYKSKLRGNFSLAMACDGAGCPGLDDSEIVFPDETNYTKGCAERLTTALSSQFVSADGYSVSLDEVKLLSGWNRFAVEAYVRDSGDWLDEADLEEWGLEVDAIYMDGGAIINVTEGGDYSMDYVFDADANLIMSYFNDQSPWPTWYCGTEGEPNLNEEEPGEDCAGSIVRDLVRDPNNEEVIEGTVGEDTLFRVQHGAKVFRERSGLAADADVTFMGVDWSKSDFGAGSEVTYQAEGAESTTYIVSGEDQWDAYVLFERGGDHLVTHCIYARD